MTMISSSRSPPWRTSRPTRRQRSRYSNDISTTRSLNQRGRDHPQARRIRFLYPTGCFGDHLGRGKRRTAKLELSREGGAPVDAERNREQPRAVGVHAGGDRITRADRERHQHRELRIGLIPGVIGSHPVAAVRVGADLLDCTARIAIQADLERGVRALTGRTGRTRLRPRRRDVCVGAPDCCIACPIGARRVRGPAKPGHHQRQRQGREIGMPAPGLGMAGTVRTRVRWPARPRRRHHRRGRRRRDIRVAAGACRMASPDPRRRVRGPARPVLRSGAPLRAAGFRGFTGASPAH
jgi:hypothetical protein